jgi:hypothetical protein
VTLIAKLETEIRALIVSAEQEKLLASHRYNYFTLIACPDAIGDTEVALAAYCDSNYPAEVGLQYLLAYGVLQAMVLQQDAVKHLSEAFGSNYQRASDLQRVRELRNKAIGHSTRKGRLSSQSVRAISRRSLRHRGRIKLLSSSDGQPETSEEIDILKLVRRQAAILTLELGAFLEELRERSSRCSHWSGLILC